jgi:hypothetical protein
VVLRGLALRLQALVAHEARAARDVERDHDPVARLEVGHLAADLLDDAHRLMAEDVALVEERSHDLVEVEIRTADRGRRDPNDRVGRVLDHRVRHVIDAYVSLAVPRDRLHA